MSRAVNIICTRVRHSFASAVMMDDYRKVDAKYCLKEFSPPYALALDSWWLDPQREKTVEAKKAQEPKR